ncbi:hypothetical protein JYU34_007290 [Plutella xylostella]|uniref:Uncharacterized protein n=1 Tax=Plutella xylostella TaxID=51655 RepID=A0ABQ7QQ15_PLUXY|nr:hypothetical protein JYU34_007290 [Plutella xylostella]
MSTLTFQVCPPLSLERMFHLGEHRGCVCVHGMAPTHAHQMQFTPTQRRLPNTTSY